MRPDGTVTGLEYADVNWMNSFPGEGIVDPAQQEQLAQEVKRAIALYSPQAANDARHWVCSQGRSGDNIYLEYTFYSQAQDAYAPDAVAPYALIQVAPVVRIIRLSLEEHVGNG